MTTTAIKFDSAKTTTASTFGRGLLRSTPYYGTMPFTAADEAAYVEMMAEETALNRRVDRLAEEAAALARLESGLDA